ncbi:MAG: MFS transporter [Verrucomicrobia bacterium]|nr:MFS transporter [Verrucomicrobiota bacterium]
MIPPSPHSVPVFVRSSRRNYGLLLASQFLGAFGDNALLAAILGPLTFQREAGVITEQAVSNANAIYSGVFFIPFVLLAPLAGYLNDRHPKTAWLLGGNLIKLLGTILGAAGLMMRADWQAVAYLVVGIGACVYSPAKYGILPEVVPAARLVKANGTVEMLTLVAILTGLWAGATLVDHLPLPSCYAVIAGIYAAAAALNLFMTRTPCNPQARLAAGAVEFWANLRGLVAHPRLGRVLLGCGLFWFAGATLRTNLQSWGLEVLNAAGGGAVTNEQLARLKIWMAVGIILGSVLAGQWHRVGDLRGARRYGWLMAAFILPLGLIGGGAGLPLITLALLLSGVSAGLFLIPFNAALQHESDPAKLGKTIATQNFVDYVAMLGGAVFVWILAHASLTAAQIFLALAVVLALAIATLTIPPPARAAVP